jgi:hypothetical protein
VDYDERGAGGRVSHATPGERHAATLDHQEAFAIRAIPSEERLSLIRLVRQNFSVMTFLIY